MSCIYRISQAKIANTRQTNLDDFDLVQEPEQWYKASNVAEKYALGYYYILYMDQVGDLPKFVKEFVGGVDQVKSEFSTQFKTVYSELITEDLIECGW